MVLQESAASTADKRKPRMPLCLALRGFPAIRMHWGHHELASGSCPLGSSGASATGSMAIWFPSGRVYHRGLAVSVEELPENIERLGRFAHDLHDSDNIAVLQAEPAYHLGREVKLPFILRTHHSPF